MKVKVLVIKSCPTLCDPMDCSLPGSSVHWILQATLEWVATETVNSPVMHPLSCQGDISPLYSPLATCADTTLLHVLVTSPWTGNGSLLRADPPSSSLSGKSVSKVPLSTLLILPCVPRKCFQAPCCAENQSKRFHGKLRWGGFWVQIFQETVIKDSPLCCRLLEF